MKKKVMTFLFCLCMVFAATSWSSENMVWAQEDESNEIIDSEDGNYAYRELEDGTIEIRSIWSNETELVIPDKIDGKVVTSICGYCGADEVEYLTLPEGILSIGDSAFTINENLVEVRLPESLEYIGEDAFSYCDNLEIINLPDNIRFIGKSAFHKCSKLSSITLPKNLSSLEENTLSACSGLEEIILQKGIKSIGKFAFDGCSSLKKITLPDGVLSIGDCAFYDCSNLIDIVLADTITSIGGSAFEKCSSLKEITLPKGLLSIEDSLFYGCTSLEGLTVPENVKSIGDDSFSHCDSLKSVSLPKNVQLIHADIFWNCNNLTDLWYGGSKAQLKKLYDYDWELGFRDIKVRIHCSDGTVIANYNNSGSNTVTQTKPSTQVPAKPTPVRLGDSNVSLSAASVVYTGAPLKPTVIVKDSKGRIVGAANYLLIYSNNINVGQAAVTVNMKGSYTGTVKKTFDILPKGTSITKITPKKKSISLKWKKQTTQTSGYQIQYSLKKNFQGAKITKKIPLKKNSFKLSKLKAKKKYFTRIRTYKTVNGRDYYSEWSKPKSTKPKK